MQDGTTRELADVHIPELLFYVTPCWMGAHNGHKPPFTRGSGKRSLRPHYASYTLGCLMWSDTMLESNRGKPVQNAHTRKWDEKPAGVEGWVVVFLESQSNEWTGITADTFTLGNGQWEFCVFCVISQSVRSHSSCWGYSGVARCCNHEHRDGKRKEGSREKLSPIFTSQHTWACLLDCRIQPVTNFVPIWLSERGIP